MVHVLVNDWYRLRVDHVCLNHLHRRLAPLLPKLAGVDAATHSGPVQLRLQLPPRRIAYFASFLHALGAGDVWSDVGVGGCRFPLTLRRRVNILRIPSQDCE